MPTELPLISVITVTLNDLPGLEVMTKSLAEQEYRYLEHIIVDGGSTDGTVQWLADLRPSDDVIWTSEPDAGIFDAMNKGARKANGSLILFLNSGDKFPDAQSLQFVGEDWAAKRWQWAFGEVSYVDERGRVLGGSDQHVFSARRLQRGTQFTPHPATYFQRSFFERLGGFDTKFKFAADQEFAIRACELSPPETWSRVLAEFLMGGVHSQASFSDRENLYHQMRQKNDCLILNSLLVDSAYTKSMSAYRTLRRRGAELWRARR